MLDEKDETPDPSIPKPELPGARALALIRDNLLPAIEEAIKIARSHQIERLRSEQTHWAYQVDSLNRMENMDLMKSSHPEIRELLEALFVEQIINQASNALVWTTHFVPESADGQLDDFESRLTALRAKHGYPTAKDRERIKAQIRKLCS